MHFICAQTRVDLQLTFCTYSQPPFLRVWRKYEFQKLAFQILPSISSRAAASEKGTDYIAHNSITELLKLLHLLPFQIS